MNLRVKRILRHQLLSVIGTLIVFCTFMVNDVFRDHLRETAASIASLQNVIEIRKDIWRVKAEQRKLLEMEMNLPVNRPDDEPVVEKSSGNAFQPFEIEVLTSGDDWIDDMKDESADLDQASELMHSMGDDETTAGELKSIKAEAGHLFVARNRITIAAGLHTDPANLEARWRDYEMHQSEHDIRVLQFDSKIAVKAHDIRSRSDKRFTYLSYSLYAVGSGLALFGKLFGVEVPTSRET